MSRVQGIAGAPGIALGPLVRLPELRAPAAAVDESMALPRFAEAQQQVVAHLERLAAELQAEGRADEAAIFEAQSLLAADPTLSSEVERSVEQGTALIEAVERASESMAALLSQLDDPYLRERAADVRAVGQQLIATLSGAPAELDVPAGSIVVARDLTPAQTAGLRRSGIAGFATASGTATGHVAILARALGIPAVVGLGDALLDLPDGAAAILAADEGLLIAEPSDEERATYIERRTAQQALEQRRHALIELPATTSDGRRVALWANIGHPDEARAALDLGAEGIGLFRTEFLFLDRSAAPSEDEQHAAYAAVAQVMAGRPVVVRTLDIGGDKPIPYLPQLDETNPFLGWRGIRFAMRFRELFQTQVRALLRAATAGDLRIMLPMIATPDDIAWALHEIEAAAESLRAANLSHRADLPIGIMVETPAAALTLDRLARPIRFCSIGSNDLAQYTLAADRSEGQLVQRYRHDDPAVLRLIRLVADDARRLGLELSICGELAADVEASVALVGLGIEKLSMTPSALLAVKERLRAVTLSDAQQSARRMCDEEM